MEDLDINKQLTTITTVASLFWQFLIVLVIGVVYFAVKKKRNGGNYKQAIFIGIGVVFLYLIIMSRILFASVEPIYHLVE